MPQTCPPFLGLTQFVHPSRCSQFTDNCLFLLFLFLFLFLDSSEYHESLCVTVKTSSSAQIEAATCSYQVCVRTHHVCISANAYTPIVCRFCARSIIDLLPSSGSGVWDPWPVGYQPCDLNNIVVQKQRLAYCFQLIRRQILHFSSIQCCPALNRHFRFRSVFHNLHHRISHGKLPWNKYEITRLAHWLDHWPNVSLLQQNPNCLDPTSSHLVASISFRNKLCLPSPVFRKTLARHHKIVHV